jgi:hypothetical protein
VESDPSVELETRVVPFPAQAFIDDPTLFDKVERAWRAKDWLALFGEIPVGGVMATVQDGVTFYYKRRPQPG